jgi:hypothetical protein
MKRRGNKPEDPTGEGVSAADWYRYIGCVVNEMVDPLDGYSRLAVHRYIDLGGGGEETFAQIAAELGLTTAHTRDLVKKGVSRLRHPSRLAQHQVLFEANDFEPKVVEKECPRHGLVVVRLRVPTCTMCRCNIYPNENGRPRMYCSDACRQAANRRRRRAERL